MREDQRRRLLACERVQSGLWTLGQAAQSLGLSYRQAKRVWARFQRDGEAGLAHQSRGRSSKRQIDPVIRQRALEAIAGRYADFGPTLIQEYLAKSESIVVSVATVRRWLVSAACHRPRQRRPPKHRRRRERKPCFGELVQLDGSRHDWFEGRRDWACLMVMIDDATSRMAARFYEVESTEAAMDICSVWVGKHGLPAEVYPDRHSIYRTDRAATDEEALQGVTPMTQFGRAMKTLGIRLSLARSPQAKGRVERMNGTLQDRLVKELRLRNISTIEQANELLKSSWFEELSQRFSVPPREATDLHRKAPSAANLRRILSTWETRVVGRDAVIRWSNRYFQLQRSSKVSRLANRQVTVISRGAEVLAIVVATATELLDLEFAELAAPPAKGILLSATRVGDIDCPKGSPKAAQASTSEPPKVSPTRRPSANHPWRKPLQSR